AVSAGTHRLAAYEEVREAERAGGSAVGGVGVAVGVDAACDDAGRLAPRLFVPGRDPAHDPAPQRRDDALAGCVARDAARQVEADPDAGEDGRCVPDEPEVGRVVRSPGLAGGGAAEADAADCLAGAAVDDVAHEVGDEVGGARVEDAAHAGLARPDDAAVALLDANDRAWRG